MFIVLGTKPYPHLPLISDASEQVEAFICREENNDCMSIEFKDNDQDLVINQGLVINQELVINQDECNRHEIFNSLNV